MRIRLILDSSLTFQGYYAQLPILVKFISVNSLCPSDTVIEQWLPQDKLLLPLILCLGANSTYYSCLTYYSSHEGYSLLSWNLSTKYSHKALLLEIAVSILFFQKVLYKFTNTKNLSQIKTNMTDKSSTSPYSHEEISGKSACRQV